MQEIEHLERRDISVSFKFLIVCVSLIFGTLIALNPVYGAVIVLSTWILVPVALFHKWWPLALWIAIWGLVLFSYGFNNIPVPLTPAPLVDSLVLYALIGSFAVWRKLALCPKVRKFFVSLSLLSIIGFIRLLFDIPHHGLLALRDALFIFELWSIFPAMVLGFQLGEQKLQKKLTWLFGIALLWFLLYPFREILTEISPIVGIQRPIPLLAFTSAGFISVPAFFFFAYYKKRLVSFLGIITALTVLLMVQSRGASLAFLTTLILLFFIRLKELKKWLPRFVMGMLIMVLISPFLHYIPGRLGEPVGGTTILEQLQTLLGKEGPGSGSWLHRLSAWPVVIQTVLEKPLGFLIGVGFGPDLFQGFTVGPDVLVRKPHNDFLEIWARMGIIGFLPWFFLLLLLLIEAIQSVRSSRNFTWVLALQLTLWITSFGQPAMGFAYITVVWAGLTGLWIGATIRKQVNR